MNRSFRHPFRGPRRYLRPHHEHRRAIATERRTRQPRIARNRHSLKGLLDAPSSAGSRPILRLQITGVVVFALFAVLGLRLWTLQVIQAPQYAKAVVANRVRAVPIAPPRGLILARNGVPLVTNTMNIQITLSRVTAQQHPGVIGRLAALIGETTKQVKLALADPQYSPYRPVPILANAPAVDLNYIREHPAEFHGVSSTIQNQRTYPQGTVAAHLLGHEGQITQAQLKAMKGQGYQPGSQIGQSGVESSFQQWLRGTPGTQRLEVDAQGQVVGSLGQTSPKPGDNVVLTLDLGLQKLVDQALPAEIAKLHSQGQVAPSGAAIVLDPNNGHVLAMASYPTFNPSVWVGGISNANYQALVSTANHEPALNRVIDGAYTPGSTFKLATATAALQTGLITGNTPYHDTGTFAIPNCVGTGCILHNAGGEALGTITLPMAIAASDDSFFYNLGYQFWTQRAHYGATPIQKTAAQYSMGQLTGIDIPGEAPGQVDGPALRRQQHKLYPKAYPYSGWYVGDNLQLAFGQGETALTPIELATAYATFANGGTRYAPQVAAGIVSPSGKVVKTFAPKVMGHVSLPPSIRNAMLQGFVMETTNPLGTGYPPFLGFPFSKFPIAGKTGTGSVHTANGTKQPNGLYCGFAPAYAPAYVACVVIPQAGYGDTSAAPVVRKIWDYLMVHPPAPVRLSAPATASAPTGSSAPAGSALPPAGTGSTTTTTGSTTTTTGSTTAPAG
ncbi:MAG: penicillin-binding protein 2 [Acidimicrobiales bacterium]